MPEGYPESFGRSPEVYDSADVAENPDNPATRSLDDISALPEAVRAELQRLSDPEMTSDQAFDLIGQLNNQHGLQGSPEGTYNVLHVEVPPTADGAILDIRVKVFGQMDDALSFSISRET